MPRFWAGARRRPAEVGREEGAQAGDEVDGRGGAAPRGVAGDEGAPGPPQEGAAAMAAGKDLAPDAEVPPPAGGRSRRNTSMPKRFTTTVSELPVPRGKGALKRGAGVAATSAPPKAKKRARAGAGATKAARTSRGSSGGRSVSSGKRRRAQPKEAPRASVDDSEGEDDDDDDEDTVDEMDMDALGGLDLLLQATGVSPFTAKPSAARSGSRSGARARRSADDGDGATPRRRSGKRPPRPPRVKVEPVVVPPKPPKPPPTSAEALQFVVGASEQRVAELGAPVDAERLRGLAERLPQCIEALATPTGKHAVVAATLRWLDALAADSKGRLAALRRSRHRVQKTRHESNSKARKTGTSDTKATAAAEELFRSMDAALAGEGSKLERWLRQIEEMRCLCQEQLQKPGAPIAPAGGDDGGSNGRQADGTTAGPSGAPGAAGTKALPGESGAHLMSLLYTAAEPAMDVTTAA